MSEAVRHYSLLAIILHVLASLTGCGITTQSQSISDTPAPKQPAEFCDDDRRIIETVLISLIDDVDFQPEVRTQGPFSRIALVDRIIGMPYSLEELAELRPWAGLSRSEVRAFVERNNGEVPLSEQRWDSRIMLLEHNFLTKHPFCQPSATDFDKRCPGAKGWVRALLPCYLGDGSRAFLKISYKWCAAHSAEGLFYLIRTGDGWRIEKREFNEFV